MATPKETIWDRDDHTKAKHQMLRTYLDAWFLIIASSWKSKGATFVDAFAGPGIYKDGGVGSPLIALRAARRAEVVRHGTEFRFIFIEKDVKRFEVLQDQVEREFVGMDVAKIEMINAACDDVLLEALDRMLVWGGPVFTNFDGWGVDTPYSSVARIGAGVSTEVLITFEAQWFTRFASLKDISAGDRVFGETGWREVEQCHDGPSKKRFLVDHYIDRLGSAGFDYTLTFEMLDERSNSLFLVFGTKNSLGLEKMKNAMWGIDKVNGQKFRDPRDVNQLAFDVTSVPDLTLLRRQILALLEAGSQTLEAIKEFALLKTVFKKVHAVDAVHELAKLRKVEVKRARSHSETIVRLPVNLSLLD